MPADEQASHARAGRKRYEAPTIVVFGSVEEFTRGAGTASLDASRTSRQVKAG